MGSVGTPAGRAAPILVPSGPAWYPVPAWIEGFSFRQCASATLTNGRRLLIMERSRKAWEELHTARHPAMVLEPSSSGKPSTRCERNMRA